MENNLVVIISAIIGSSALTAIVTQSFLFFQQKRNDRITIITKERLEWQKKLRSICYTLEQLKEYDKEKIRITINELTLFINPYGNSCWGSLDKKDIKGWVETDGFVWKDIERIKKS